MKIDYLDKFKGTLIGIAIGDTLGKPFNGKTRTEIISQFENFETFFMKKKRKVFKTYSDNTQLMLHVAEALIQGNGFNMNFLIRELIRWLDDPPKGEAFSCISAIRKLKGNIPWEQASTNSGGSGTLARAVPFALIYHEEIDTLKDVVELASSITHSHPAASGSAIVFSRGIAYLIKKIPEQDFLLDEFFDVLVESISDSKNKAWNDLISHLQEISKNLDLSVEAGLIKLSQIGVSPVYYLQEYLGKAFIHPYAISTIICSLFLFVKQLDSFKDFIFTIGTAGGGATAAAVGGGLAGAFHGYSKIPQELVKLVNKSNYILDVAERLYEVYKKRERIK